MGHPLVNLALVKSEDLDRPHLHVGGVHGDLELADVEVGGEEGVVAEGGEGDEAAAQRIGEALLHADVGDVLRQRHRGHGIVQGAFSNCNYVTNDVITIWLRAVIPLASGSR